MKNQITSIPKSSKYYHFSFQNKNRDELKTEIIQSDKCMNNLKEAKRYAYKLFAETMLNDLHNIVVTVRYIHD